LVSRIDWLASRSWRLKMFRTDVFTSYIKINSYLTENTECCLILQCQLRCVVWSWMYLWVLLQVKTICPG
jgi:hypothetical protein